MADTVVYLLSPSDIRRADLILWSMAGLTALVSSLACGFYGWRAWWFVPCAALVVPTAVVLLFRDGESYRLGVDFITGVVVPLASTIGLLSGLIGALLGANTSKIWRKVLK